MIAIICISFLVLLACGVPIAFVMGGVGLIGLLLHPDGLALLPSLTEQVFNQLNSFPFLTIPLFICAGAIMSEGGIAGRLMDVANMTIGRGRGGLGSAIVVAALFFHGISGSSSADTAAIGKVTLPGLRRQGYPAPFAAALLAAAGATSTLIPPSTDFILIGVVANMSIAGLFAAGLIPACINALGLILLVIYTAHKKGYGTANPPFDLKAVALAVVKAIPGLFMIVIILGGILGGIFTPTEASAVAVVYGIFLTVIVYRSLTIKRIVTMFRETIEIAGMVLTVIAMSAVLSYTLTVYQVPTALAASVDAVTNKFLPRLFRVAN
jgi:tripartite ATP-independent transporter DctM subunit